MTNQLLAISIVLLGVANLSILLAIRRLRSQSKYYLYANVTNDPKDINSILDHIRKQVPTGYELLQTATSNDGDKTFVEYKVRPRERSNQSQSISGEVSSGPCDDLPLAEVGEAPEATNRNTKINVLDVPTN